MSRIYGLLLSGLIACTPTKVELGIDSSPVIDTAPPTLGVHADEYCSQKAGDYICNLVLRDQNDQIWQLHDYQGDVIVLDFSAMWCGPCTMAAATVQDTVDKYGPYGFQYVTVLIDDESGGNVDAEDAERWATTFGIEDAPVLQGFRGLIDYSYDSGYSITSWPTFVFVDRNLRIYTDMTGFNETTIEQKIEEKI